MGDVVGGALLAAGLGAATSAAVLGAVAARTGRFARLATAGLWASAAALLSALALLARAFAVGDHSFVAVADHSRSALGTYDRVMGLWGGMAGSLLLFTAMTAAFAAIGLGRRPPPAAVAAAGAVIAALTAITHWLAEPFATLAIPALDGGGLTPILEHWAMRVHPPLVYAGLTVLIVPAALAIGTSGSTDEGAGWTRLRPWLVCSWALLGLGMLLGAHWAYAELGWGGYWAWDPVENAALLPWLAVTIALHAGGRGSGRWARTALVLPFLLALLGSALTRSGATSSVHAFAEARSIGRALTLLTAAALVTTVLAIQRSARQDAALPGRARSAACVVLGAALAVVCVGTLYPVLRGWFGGDRLAVAPTFFDAALAPIVVIGLAVQVARGRVPSAATAGAAAAAGAGLWALGWSEPAPVAIGACAAVALVTSVRILLRTRRAAELAHTGFALLLLGVAGTATGAHLTTPLRVGDSIEVAGHEVTLDGIGTRQGPTASSTAVVAELRIDGHRRSPALVAHPDRGVLLAESTLRSTPAVDVQVILRDARDDLAVLTVTVSPLQQLVWWGGLLAVAGGLLGVRFSSARRDENAWRRGATRASSSAPAHRPPWAEVGSAARRPAGARPLREAPSGGAASTGRVGPAAPPAADR